jgi:glycosyltransferase involved in cell wall biosynthesis
MPASTEKLPLSLVLIARNEAANLPRCLDSVAPWAREIVVVVNDCTDDTVAIARRYGARVFENPWQGHRDQKNVALGHATQPWVLCIDADEEVSPALAGSIRDFIIRDDQQLAGAYFARKVWFLGRWIRHGDWYPDYSLRLLRRGRGRWGGSREHDKMELDGPTEKLAGDLHHYTCPSLRDHLQKIGYFGDIFLRRQLDRGSRWSALNAIFRAKWRFFRGYFIRLGFLDGFPGLYIACYMSFATFYRYVLLFEHEQSQLAPAPPSEDRPTTPPGWKPGE